MTDYYKWYDRFNSDETVTFRPVDGYEQTLNLVDSLKELRDNYANATYESAYYDMDNFGSITNDYKVQAEDLLMDDIDFKKTLGRLGFTYRYSDLTFGSSWQAVRGLFGERSYDALVNKKSLGDEATEKELLEMLAPKVAVKTCIKRFHDVLIDHMQDVIELAGANHLYNMQYYNSKDSEQAMKTLMADVLDVNDMLDDAGLGARNHLDLGVLNEKFSQAGLTLVDDFIKENETRIFGLFDFDNESPIDTLKRTQDDKFEWTPEIQRYFGRAVRERMVDIEDWEALKFDLIEMDDGSTLTIDECKSQLFDYVASIDHLDWDDIDHERVAKPGFDTNELRAWDNASFEKWVKGELDGADVKRRHQLFVPSAGHGEQLSFDFDC